MISAIKPLTSPITRRLLGAVAACAALVAFAAVADASVAIYQNDFSSKAEYKELRKSGGGKKCGSRYRKQAQTLVASVKKAPASCGFRPPVQGDGALPDHQLRLDAKLLPKTPKSARKRAFLSVELRAGAGGVGYQLKVFPKKKRYELTRSPGGGGGGFPAKGKSGEINGIGERNRLTLQAFGARVRALVNGEEVADVSDDNPGQVDGQKLRIGLGAEQKAGKGAVAAFKKLRIAIPSP